MLLLSEHHEFLELNDHLRHAQAVTAELLSEVIDKTPARSAPPADREERPAQAADSIGRLDRAALALIDLELPQWRLRRIAYDGGEWHCALSRQRELPDWLDSPIEAHHADLALAILGALVEARGVAAPPSRTSVPVVPHDASALYEPVCCDNFA